MTIREQILDALVAALGAEGSPAPVSRWLAQVLDGKDLPAIVVMEAGEDCETIGLGEQQLRTFNADVVCVVGGMELEGPVGKLADPLLEWVVRVIGQNRDLGGLAFHLVETGTAWQHETGELDFLGAVVHLQLQYHTLGDASTVGESET